MGNNMEKISYKIIAISEIMVITIGLLIGLFYIEYTGLSLPQIIFIFGGAIFTWVYMALVIYYMYLDDSFWKN